MQEFYVMQKGQCHVIKAFSSEGKAREFIADCRKHNPRGGYFVATYKDGCMTEI